MQITLNQAEAEGILAAHVASIMPHIEPEEVTSVQINEDGTVLVIIGEEVHEDTPPVVEKKQRAKRTPRNPAEAKHVPVAAKEELQTKTGGQNESSTSVTEPEAAHVEGDTSEPTEQLKEEATAEAEDNASQEVAEEAKVQEEAQEEKAADTPAAKPSLFANLRK